MIQKAVVRPQHSILFLEDVGGGEIPTPPAKDDPAQAWATQSCILFHIFPEPDGPTEVTMGPHGEVDPGMPPKFSREIKTPSRALRVVQSDDTVVFQTRVSGSVTKVSIWFNHPRWPDKVTIGLG